MLEKNGQDVGGKEKKKVRKERKERETGREVKIRREGGMRSNTKRSGWESKQEEKEEKEEEHEGRTNRIKPVSSYETV